MTDTLVVAGSELSISEHDTSFIDESMPQTWRKQDFS